MYHCTNCELVVVSGPHCPQCLEEVDARAAFLLPARPYTDFATYVGPWTIEFDGPDMTDVVSQIADLGYPHGSGVMVIYYVTNLVIDTLKPDIVFEMHFEDVINMLHVLPDRLFWVLE